MKKITLITTTGSRPRGFELCQNYMERQSVWKTHDIQWLVIDDSPKRPTECRLNQDYYVGPLEWGPSLNTQRYSLNFALTKVRPESEAIFIIQDDDHFSEKYLEVQLDFLKYAEMVGETDVTYYNIAKKSFMEMKNLSHASTCQTAFRKSYIPHFYRALHSGQPFFDILLWNTAKAARHKVVLHHGLNLCVGIKGLPGRTGIGVGHQDTSPFVADPHFVKLKELVGPEDAAPYIAMMEGK